MNGRTLKRLAQALFSFFPRLDVHARFDAEQGHWVPVWESPTPHLVEEHLLGNLVLGTYVLTPENTVHFIVFDVDFHDRSEDEAWEDVERLHALCPDMLIEFSGRGYHLWLFLDALVPAREARLRGEELVRQAGAKAEVFPKQDTLGPKGLGNLIRLPLGLHPVTKGQSRFLNEMGHAYTREEALTLLHRLPRVSLDVLPEPTSQPFAGDIAERRAEAIRRVVGGVREGAEWGRDPTGRVRAGRNEAAFTLSRTFANTGIRGRLTCLTALQWNWGNEPPLGRAELHAAFSSGSAV